MNSKTRSLTKFTKSLLAPVVILVFLTAGVAALVWWPKNGEQTQSGEWTCSMHPQVRRSGPGQCPICGMDLIPVSQLTAEKDRLAVIGVETEPVTFRELAKELRTVGKFDFSESHIAYIPARIDGRVDRVFADVVGTEVKKGHHLVEIFSSKLNVDQGSLILALQDYERLRSRQASNDLESTRERLRLLGIMPEQIEQIERTRKTTDYLTIYAPIGGTIIEKNVRPGQYVNKGDILYRIASLDPIWLFLDIYESDLAWIRYGQQAEVYLEAYPGEVFKGTVSFIDPFLNDQTRTVKVRVTLKNEDRRLKPFMYASAVINVALGPDGKPMPTGLEGKLICPMHPDVIKDASGTCPICGMDLVQVPSAPPGMRATPPAVSDAHKNNHEGHGEHAAHEKGEEQPDRPEQPTSRGVLAVRATAVLDTGKRQVVYRKSKQGAFDLIEVQLGPRATAQIGDGRREDFFPVIAGLAEGDEIVIRGAFLLDSQRQIEGMPSLLYEAGRSPASLHAGHDGETPSSPSPNAAGHKH